VASAAVAYAAVRKQRLSSPRSSSASLERDARNPSGRARIRKVEFPLAEGTVVPLGFDKKRLNFLRYRFDASGLPDGAAFSFLIFDREAAREFPALTTKWTRYYVESDKGVEHKMHPEDKSVSQLVLDSEPGEFKLPPEGQLSPVLVTYAYARFGSSPG
jgi:hypothetical protein